MSSKKLLVLICTLAITVSIVSSQNSTDVPSPSPAPSKTPVPSPTVEESIAEEDDIAETSQSNALQRSYTQEDLSVLVANVQRPNGLIWLDERLYAACSGDWTLYEIQATTGATITFLSGIQDAQTLFAEETDAGFNLWIPDFDRNALMRVDHRRTAPASIATELEGPWGIAPIQEEGFLVTNLRGNNIVYITREGIVEQIMSDLRAPAGIAVDKQFVYFANNGSARRSLEWFTFDEAGTASSPQPLVTGLQNASNVLVADDGFLYFTYALGTRGVVGRIQPDECRDQACTNDQIEIVVYSDMPAPLAGLTVSPDMRLYFHTIYRPEIYWVDLYAQQ